MVKQVQPAEPGRGLTPSGLELAGKLDDLVLIKLVLEAVHEFDTESATASLARNAFNSAQTATLLGYCYSRGILSSEEIEARLPHDPAIAYICAGKKPDWHLLRRFRRDNALLILGILTRVLELAASQTGACRPADLPDRWRLAFREQALARLQEAIQADSLAMDQ
jgi:hypothetical protein